MRLAWILLAISLPLSAFAADEGSDEQVVQGIGCKNGQEERRLEVHTRGPGCVLQYTKSGKSSEVAHSRHGVDLCQEHLQKMRANLEKGGYHCG